MIGSAARVATLPLRRRRVGSVVVVAGVAVTALGFLLELGSVSAGTPAGGNTAAPGDVQSAVAGAVRSALPTGVGGDTPAAVLHHSGDHALAGADTIGHLADAATRGGVIAMAVGAAFALILLVLPLGRGLIGWAGGLGLLGLGGVTGVVVGTSRRLPDVAGGGLHVAVGPAVPVLAFGMLGIVAGGSLAALRPLAGLGGAITLTVLGIVAGVALAVVVGSDAGLVTAVPGG